LPDFITCPWAKKFTPGKQYCISKELPCGCLSAAYCSLHAIRHQQGLRKQTVSGIKEY